MVKGGQVVSEHSDQSSRSHSPSPSKTSSDNEYEIPCESDLLVTSSDLFQNLWMTPKEKIFSTPAALSPTSLFHDN